MDSFGQAQPLVGDIEGQGQFRASSSARRDRANACTLFLSLFWKGSPDSGELRPLYRLATPVTLSAGKTIFSEGEHADSVFGLSQGSVRLYKNASDGRRQIVAFALPGEFLGMPLAKSYHCSADAIDQVVLCRFPRAGFANFIQTAPNTMRRLIDFATRELDMALGLSVLLGHASAEQRLTTFFIEWRKRIDATSQFVPLPMLRQDIADFLGLKPETISRTLAKLEAKNVIRVVPKGVVLNRLDETTMLPPS